MASSSLVDTRTLGKPPTFNGRAEDWTMWAFKFESWASLLPPVGDDLTENEFTVEQALEWATQQPDDLLTINAMSANVATASRNVYYMLAQLLDGRAMAILRRTPKGQGLMAWKRLKAEYEGADGARAVSLLMGLLQPS